MAGYVPGVSREQVVLFPEALDEYIAPENPARFIDAFVQQLDMDDLGFSHAQPMGVGRPAYDPRDLLKLYVYGYLNRIRSSRRLEQEAGRNLELMWLLRKLTPDFKTIADFRKHNLAAFKQVFRQFTLLCQQLDLFGAELVAIDGSKFKAVNSRDRNFTKAKLQRRLQEIDAKINGYLQSLEQADATEAEMIPSQPAAADLQAKIQALQTRQGRYAQLLEALERSGESQISLTDPDSRSMPKSPKVDVAYNVQVAVDSKHKLIVEQDVTNAVTDQNQLSPLALAAQEALGVDSLDVVADRGYYDGAEVKTCADHGITCYIEKPMTSANTKLGLFGKERFRYDAAADCYVCPGQQTLRFHFESEEDGRRTRYYWTTACNGCPLKAQCTRDKDFRRIKRWVHEEILEAMQARLRAEPNKLKRRKTLVEHPFGTLKQWWDQEDFLMKGLGKVRAEFSLSALAYNMKRAMNIVGVQSLLGALG
jgi:transposase